MVTVATRTGRGLGDGLGAALDDGLGDGLGPNSGPPGLDGRGDDSAGDAGAGRSPGGELAGSTAGQAVRAGAVTSGDGSGLWALATEATMATRAGTSTRLRLEIGAPDMSGLVRVTVHRGSERTIPP